MKMTFKDTLERRKSSGSDNSNISDLQKIIDDIESFADGHLKRVTQVLSEFDIHDISHSQKVIENIEHLLGKQKVGSLSSYELFFLQSSALLHDCAMAPAEWEISVMKQTEGTETHYELESSLKRDLKAPFSYKESIHFINESWSQLNVDLNWMFCPESENELKKELALLITQYQEYRNGYKSQIENIKTIEEFKTINKQIRINFIRINHHLRIENYIKNLSKYIGQIINQETWGKKISKDLASICRSHGENLSYIYNLDTESRYINSEKTNIQFIAIMLRLGDVIHYSYDRAPKSIFSGKVFNSNHSFQEWAIKNNGVNYHIKDGVISFKAYCTNPNDYFKLHKYVDYIDKEIQNYFILSRHWDERYKIKLDEKVDRTGIKNDEDEFLPITGLNFRINQKQIIELLMGVGLYKDKYACLRELYQNALDACRTASSYHTTKDIKKGYKIIFYIEKIENNTYLVCHDNGIGMNKNIIEGYLLNIGNSYYKSSKFYQEQARWSGEFTPTSQFGIGILSCFMLGSRIDIVTKRNNEDLVSCSIEGPHESFYYRKNDILDEEIIGESGTIIRVLLLDNVLDELIDEPIDNITLTNISYFKKYELNHLPESLLSYKDILKNWDNNLFSKLNDFIGHPFENISACVKFNNNEIKEIPKKPYIIDYKSLNLYDHIDFLNYIYERKLNGNNYNYSNAINSIEWYDITVLNEGTNFTMFLCLPTKDYESNNTSILHSIPRVPCKSCIDGISIEQANIFNFESKLFYLDRIGYFDFNGKIRPQLSVDRKSITSVSAELEEQAKDILSLIIDKSIETLTNHNKKHSVELNDSTFDIGIKYLFETFGFCNEIFLPKVLSSDIGNCTWTGLSKHFKTNRPIKELISNKEEVIISPNSSKLDTVSKSILHSVLSNSKEINVFNDEVIVTPKVETNDIYDMVIYERNNEPSSYELLFCSNSWEIDNKEYDIVTNLLPVIPKKLFDALDSRGIESRKTDKIAKVNNYSNGICAFIDQDPLLIHSKFGIYTKENKFRDTINKREKSSVLDFSNKRNSFYLNEINTFDSLRQKQITWLYIFVSPKELNSLDLEKIREIQDEEDYLKGVKEGWSILITGMEINNHIIKSGRRKRIEMVNCIPKSFWNEYSDYNFTFVDGCKVN